MPEYNFDIYIKSTIWEAHSYKIDALTYEDAEARMKEMLNGELSFEESEGFRETNTLYDTMEESTECVTRELYSIDKSCNTPIAILER